MINKFTSCNDYLLASVSYVRFVCVLEVIMPITIGVPITIGRVPKLMLRLTFPFHCDNHDIFFFMLSTMLGHLSGLPGLFFSHRRCIQNRRCYIILLLHSYRETSMLLDVEKHHCCYLEYRVAAWSLHIHRTLHMLDSSFRGKLGRMSHFLHFFCPSLGVQRHVWVFDA